jgi:hypothetical protein
MKEYFDLHELTKQELEHYEYLKCREAEQDIYREPRVKFTTRWYEAEERYGTIGMVKGK